MSPVPTGLQDDASRVALHGVRREFPTRGGRVVAIDDVTLAVPERSFVTLLGPSGCGKSTLLRLMAGLDAPDGGSVSLGGRLVADADAGTNVPANHRDIGMVFQSYAIWPHMSVKENVAYPLRIAREPRATIGPRVEETLELVGLGGLGGRRPGQLSGGQQQRVALARAIIRQPSLLLLDEPFSNLDTDLRENLGDEVRRLQQELGLTVVYVTHDRHEAMMLSDLVAVMDRGRLVQYGTPEDVLHRPRTRFVAQFVGATNILEGRLSATDSPTDSATDGGSTATPMSSVSVEVAGEVVGEIVREVATDLGSLRATLPPDILAGMPIERRAGASTPVLVSIRPEDISRVPDGGPDIGPAMIASSDLNLIRARVTSVHTRGHLARLSITTGTDDVRLDVPIGCAGRAGEEIILAVPIERTIVIRDDHPHPMR